MTEKNKGGRPSKLDDLDMGVVELLATKGFTDKQMAQILDVTEKTFNTWKKKNEGFLQSLKDGKSVADSKVEASLYERAIGYSHPEDKIFNNNGKALTVKTTKHYAPDTAAAFIWLKNRKGWKDKTEVEVSGSLADTLKAARERAKR